MGTVSHSLLPPWAASADSKPSATLETYPWTVAANTFLRFRRLAPELVERVGIGGAKLLGSPARDANLQDAAAISGEWLFAPPPALRPQLHGVESSATAWQEIFDRQQPPGVQAILLYEAGAAALGVWADGELIEHKAFRRYVVRGNGKAQALHLKTKGRSRYGSRLRLQNAERLQAEVLERLTQWNAEHGPFVCLWRHASVRLFATLSQDGAKAMGGRLADPQWCRPLPCAARTVRFDELRRCWGFLAHGVWRGPVG